MLVIRLPSVHCRKACREPPATGGSAPGQVRDLTYEHFHELFDRYIKAFAEALLVCRPEDASSPQALHLVPTPPPPPHTYIHTHLPTHAAVRCDKGLVEDSMPLRRTWTDPTFGCLTCLFVMHAFLTLGREDFARWPAAALMAQQGRAILWGQLARLPEMLACCGAGTAQYASMGSYTFMIPVTYKQSARKAPKGNISSSVLRTPAAFEGW